MYRSILFQLWNIMWGKYFFVSGYFFLSKLTHLAVDKSKILSNYKNLLRNSKLCKFFLYLQFSLGRVDWESTEIGDGFEYLKGILAPLKPRLVNKSLVKNQLKRRINRRDQLYLNWVMGLCFFEMEKIVQSFRMTRKNAKFEIAFNIWVGNFFKKAIYS